MGLASFDDLDRAPFHLDPGDVTRICCLVAGQPHIIVGGQALNFWAEYYSEWRPELVEYQPYTSRDIDFVGFRELGEFLASQLGATVHYPGLDDHTPNAAIVTASIGGREIVIDILTDALGIKESKLKRAAVELEVPFVVDDQAANIALVLMNPMHCFVSRAISIHHPAIMRRDAYAIRQFRASLWVLDAFFNHAIDLYPRQAGRWLIELAHFLAKDPIIRQVNVPEELDFDPIEILRRAEQDHRLDVRFRSHQVARAIEFVAAQRASVLARSAQT